MNGRYVFELGGGKPLLEFEDPVIVEGDLVVVVEPGLAGREDQRFIPGVVDGVGRREAKMHGHSRPRQISAEVLIEEAPLMNLGKSGLLLGFGVLEQIGAAHELLARCSAGEGKDRIPLSSATRSGPLPGLPLRSGNRNRCPGGNGPRGGALFRRRG